MGDLGRFKSLGGRRTVRVRMSQPQAALDPACLDETRVAHDQGSPFVCLSSRLVADGEGQGDVPALLGLVGTPSQLQAAVNGEVQIAACGIVQ